MARLSIPLSLALTIASLFIPGVLSQANVPPCILDCLTAGATSNGCSPTDANCVCNSQAVADAVASCAVDQCSISDIQAAEGFVNDFCSGTTPFPSDSLTLQPIVGTPIPSASVPLGQSSSFNPFESSSSVPLGPSGSLNPSQPTVSGPFSSVPTGSESATPSGPSSGPASTASPTLTSPTSTRSSTAPGSSTTSGSSRASSATPATPTPSPVNHAKRGATAGSLTNIGIALALALAAW